MFFSNFLFSFFSISLGYFFYKFYKNIDCDLTLLFYSFFGNSLDSLNDKVVWITGASSGIGEHVAYKFAKQNCKLILSGTNTSKLESVRSKCLDLMKSNKDENVVITAFDLSKIDSHQAAVDKALNSFQKIDILINNAGRSQRAGFEDISIEVDKEIFNINVFGTINLSRILLKHWLENKQKGHFVVLSSTAGIFPAPFISSYNATKHALHGYFETLDLELHKKGISVTIVCPGPVVSDISKNAFTHSLDQKAEIRNYKEEKRMNTERCAHLIAIATINKLSQVWISLNPVLFLHYMIQYMPTTTKFLLSKIFTKERYLRLRNEK